MQVADQMNFATVLARLHAVRDIGDQRIATSLQAEYLKEVEGRARSVFKELAASS